MKRISLLAILLVFAFTAYAQEGLSVRMDTDQGFSDYNGTVEATAHLQPFKNFGNLFHFNSKYSKNFENGNKQRSEAITTEVNTQAIDPGDGVEDLGFNVFDLFRQGKLNGELERAWLAYALAENFGKIKIIPDGQDVSSKDSILITSKEYFIKYSKEGKIPISMWKMATSYINSDYTIVVTDYLDNKISLTPGYYLFKAGSKDFGFISDDPKPYGCSIGDVDIKDFVRNKDGDKCFVFTVRNDYSIVSGIVELDAKAVVANTEGAANILAEFSYFPNPDENYLLKVLFELVDTSFISPISSQEAMQLKRNRPKVYSEKSGDVPISQMSVEEVYSIFFNKWNKYVSLLITADDMANVKKKFADEKISDDDLRIEAMRSKIIWFIQEYNPERKTQALKVLVFVMKYSEVKDPEKVAIALGREISEQCIINPAYGDQIEQMVNKGMSSKKSRTANDTYFDVIFGIKTTGYGTPGGTFAKAGAGVVFGKSYVYGSGYVALPVDVSNINWYGQLNTNFRFNNWLELTTDADYYSNNRLNVNVKPNFVLADIVNIGPVFNFDVMPTFNMKIGAEVQLLNKFLTVGILAPPTFSTYNVYATIKL